MKISQFVGGLSVLLVLGACEKTPENVEPDAGYDDAYYASTASVSSSDENFTPTAEGGAISFEFAGGTVAVNVDCGTAWTVENHAADLFQTDANVSGGVLTVTAGLNTSSSSLSESVSLKTAASGIVFATIVLTQDSYTAPTVSVDPTSLSFPAAGALSAEVAVDAPRGEVGFSSSYAWITGEVSDAGIMVTVAENPDASERSGQFTVSCTDGYRTARALVQVSQEAHAYISTDSDEFSFYEEAGSASLSVASNYDWDFSYDESNGWFTVVRDGDTLTASVLENTGEDNREGSVTLTAGDGADNTAELVIPVSQVGTKSGTMILEYTITSANTTVTLPFGSGFEDVTINCKVDWRDGSAVQTVTWTQPTHTYSEPGVYNVRVNGTMTGLRSADADGNTTLTAVKQWGDTGLTSMFYAFFRCYALASLPEETGAALEGVSQFWSSFHECTSLTELPGDLFADCPQGFYFFYTFYGCTSLKEIPEGLFDGVNAAASFQFTFLDCTGIESIPESLFDNCGSSELFGACFYNCTGLKSLPAGLFGKCLFANAFPDTFHGCTGLTGESPYTVVDGVKVHLYERTEDNGFNEPEYYGNCFTGCDGLTDIEAAKSAGWY